MIAFRRYVFILLMLSGMLSFYIPVRYQAGYPQPIGPQFDNFVRQTNKKYLVENQPQIMMLGDSLLIAGVDELALSDALGRKTYNAGVAGSASALWYLILKNNVVESPHRPQTLIIVFRDTMLTTPGYRVYGSYFEQIDEYAGPHDFILIERAYINQMNPFEKLAEAYLPVYGSRLRLREALDTRIRYTLPGLILKCDARCTNRAMTTVFQGGNLEQNILAEAIASAEDYLYTPRALDFEGSVDTSFLPEIIQLCKDQDIQLVLVRARTLRFTSEPPGLKTYVEDLASYLDQRGVPFLDFSRDERLTSDLYADILHLNEAGKAIFTEMLAEALEGILE